MATIRLDIPEHLWEHLKEEAAASFRTPRAHCTMLLTQSLERRYRPKPQAERWYPLPVGEEVTSEPTTE